MELVCESPRLGDYLAESAVIDASHPLVREALRALAIIVPDATERERVGATYRFVRDGFAHSMDIGSERVTIAASEVARHGEGLCFAKSHLLAALLRAQGIPTGFCYQRLLLGETPAEGYTLHGLNAVYLATPGRWLRLDARSNKLGIQADFTDDGATLAYTPRTELGERDYPTIYAEPQPVVLRALREHDNCRELCARYLPSEL